MARPREFDEAEVLDAALETFWMKGYEGTSIQDLVDATGLGRASLYGAFGDKQELFQRVLARYRDRTAVEARQLEGEPSVRKGLERLFRSWINLTCPKSGPRGCFLLLAGMTGDLADERTREAVAERSREVERMIERAIKRGQQSGELARGRDPSAVARLLLVVLQGLATAARQGWGRDRLEGVVAEALAGLDRRDLTTS